MKKEETFDNNSMIIKICKSELATIKHYTNGSVFLCGDNYRKVPPSDLEDAPDVIFNKSGNIVAFCGGIPTQEQVEYNEKCYITCEKTNLCKNLIQQKYDMNNVNVIERKCREISKFAKQNAQTAVFMRCKEYYDKRCTSDSDCGPFPCNGTKCLIKPCNEDAECPRVCGLHLTAVPGFCTTNDAI
ncbi:hypothetical protein J4230_05540 [Candidatus Woesearchaeota archaeon]|nr:hypothetical protein [Candidatus Woesearchaeota archaeon]